MRNLRLPLLTVLVATLFSSALRAQDLHTTVTTNAPKTKLEAFEARHGTLIVKASGPIGSVPTRTATVLVRYRESIDAGAAQKEHGVAVTIQHSERDLDTTIINYDELDLFLAGLDFISRVDFSVTPLPSFDVSYQTRGELRVFVYSSNNRPGTIQFALHDGRPGKPWVLLTSDQFAAFKTHIESAKSKLDQLRANK